MRLKNNWYVVALGATASAISVVYDLYIILLLYFIWLLYLFFFCHLKHSLLLFSIIAVVFYYFHFPPPSPPQDATPPKQVNLQGKTKSVPVQTDKKIEIILQNKKYGNILLLFIKDDNRKYNLNYLQAGASCTVSGDLLIPDEATNPHEFDYQNYLWHRDIRYQMVLSSLDAIECEEHSWLGYLFKFRSFLLQTASNKFEEETYQWFSALVLGDDHSLGKQTTDLFQRWGLSHVLAISGLHVGIIVALIYFVSTRIFLFTKESVQTFFLLFLPLYALLAGSQPSVWRASLMTFLVIFLTKWNIKLSYTDVISIIFLGLIFLQNHIIYHVGFQFSFLVSFAIILSQDWIQQSKTKLEAAFKLSFVAQMAILPLQLHYFSHFQPLSILLNLLVVPYFSLFVIPLMFLFIFIGFLPNMLLLIFEYPFIFIQNLVIKALTFLDYLIPFGFTFSHMQMSVVFLYYVLFVFMMAGLEKQHAYHAFGRALLLCGLVIVLALRPYLSPYGTVTMLDIGQGDAFIIEMPYRKGVYFYDAGARFSYDTMEASENVYKQVIQPYLKGQGIQEIDAIFVSHEHLDHDGSISFIQEDFTVHNIITSEYYEWTEEKREVWKNVHIASFNEIIKLQNQSFQVVSPQIETDSADDNSLVLYTELGGLRWLFTGDVGKETERKLIENFPEMEIDVLKVPHHGSDTSTDESLAEKSKQGVGLISLGEHNSYGHPNQEVLDTLKKYQIKVYRTDQAGAVIYRFKGKEGEFEVF